MCFSLVWEGFCPRGTPRAMDMGTAGWPCTRQPVKPVNTIAVWLNCVYRALRRYRGIRLSVAGVFYCIVELEDDIQKMWPGTFPPRGSQASTIPLRRCL